MKMLKLTNGIAIALVATSVIAVNLLAASITKKQSLHSCGNQKENL